MRRSIPNGMDFKLIINPLYRTTVYSDEETIYALAMDRNYHPIATYRHQMARTTKTAATSIFAALFPFRLGTEHLQGKGYLGFRVATGGSVAFIGIVASLLGYMLWCWGDIGVCPARWNFAPLEEKLKDGGALPGWLDRISMSGVIEVEAGFESLEFADPDAEDEDSSDLSLATAELGIESVISDHVSGFMLLLYEDGEDIVSDEVFLTLSGGEDLPLYPSVGVSP